MEEKYYIPDIETGFKLEVSKETWESYVVMWECCLPKTNTKGIGTIHIFGTGNELENTDNNYDIFYQNDFSSNRNPDVQE